MTVLRTRPVTYILFRPYGGTAFRMLLLLGRQPLLHQTPVVRIYRCLDDVCYRCRQPRFSKLHFRHRNRRLSVGPRFECLQTKRCALLWSVSYPCSIFHTLVSRLPSSSAPAFRLHVYSRRCLTRSELASSAHNSDNFFRGLV